MKKRSKIDANLPKINAKSCSGGFGCSGPTRGRSGTRLERPRDAKSGRLSRQAGRLGGEVGGSGRQVGRLKRQLASLGCLCALVERVGRANLSPSSVRSEFSLDVGTIAKSRKLEFRAPTQCFVRVGRSAETLTAEAKNIGENVVSVSKIEPQSVSGASREHLNHPSRAEKRQLERYRTAERFFFWQFERAGRNAEPKAASRGAERGTHPRDPV